MVGGTQFSPWQGLRGESGPNWHSTIRVPAAARDKRPDDSPVVFRSAGTGRRGGRGRSMPRERVTTAITRSPLAGRASEPPRARRSAGPSASSPCPSPSAPQRHTFTPSWKTPSFPPPRGSKPRRALVRAKAGATHPSRRRDPTPTPSDRSLTEPLA